MSSNYGYDANGWEREPFPARDEHANRTTPKVTAYRLAIADHPMCRQCRAGWGTITPGPGHCATHDTHCSAAPCW